MLCWQELGKAVLSIMCCYASRVEEADSEPATLRTLRPTSAGSTALTSSAVPHGIPEATGVSDEHALRQIFSSSSVRGYQAAVAPLSVAQDHSESREREVRTSDSRSTTRKSVERLEKLGHNLKQRLSEVRSTEKENTKPCNSGHDVGERKYEGSMAFSTSHRSTALSDILMLGTTSGGGYDSDAKSIETTMFASNTNTLRGVSAPNDGISQHIEAVKEKERDSETAVRVHSQYIGTSPSTPDNIQQFSTANSASGLKVGAEASVTTSDGISDLPDTPRLEPLHLPGIKPAQGDWRFSMPLTRQISGQQTVSHEFKTMIKEKDADEKAEIEGRNVASKQSGLISAHQRLSTTLASGGPSPKKFSVESANKAPETEDANFKSAITSRQNLKGTSIESELKDEAEGTTEFTEYTDTSGRNSFPVSRDSPLGSQCKMSEEDSIHLSNMRISQRLAINSLKPGLSPSQSTSGSVASGSMTSQVLQPTAYIPKFPSCVTHEHNRRPSDPQTKKIFEHEAKSNASSQWQTITSVDSASSDKRVNQMRADVKLSQNSFGREPNASIINDPRWNLLSPSNSIGVSRRYPSGNFSNSSTSWSQQSKSEKNPWLGEDNPRSQQNSEDAASWLEDDDKVSQRRSITLPVMNLSVDSQKKSVVKKTAPGSVGSTEVNEIMSEISLNALKDRRDETFSEITTGEVFEQPHKMFRRTALEPGTKLTQSRPESSSVEWLSLGNLGDWRLNSLNSTPRNMRRMSQDLTQKGMLQDSATNMWERALKKAREDEASGAAERSNAIFLLPPSQFDRQGHRKSSRSSSCENHGGRAERSNDLKRSRSEERMTLNGEQQQKYFPRTDTPVGHDKLHSTGGESLSKPVKQKNKRSKSVLDLRSLTTSTPPNSNHLKRKTNIKDIFGSWARFSSDNRAIRNGSAGVDDGVRVRDFQSPVHPQDSKMEFVQKKNITSASESLRGCRTPSTIEWRIGSQGSWNFFGFRERNKKSLSMMSQPDPNHTSKSGSLPLIRDRGKRGITQTVQRLYRSSSTDLQNYVKMYGHRGSVCRSDKLEYPELELLPGEGLMEDAFMRNMTKNAGQRTETYEGAAPQLDVPKRHFDPGLPKDNFEPVKADEDQRAEKKGRDRATTSTPVSDQVSQYSDAREDLPVLSKPMKNDI